MATAPEPKNTEQETETPDAPPKSRKRLWIALAAVTLLAAGGGGAAWWFLRPAHEAPKVAKPAPPAPPVFVELETFTVNLAGDRILQTTLTLQVGKVEDADQLKVYMPQVKNRLLMLLSSKNVDELQTTEGKESLRADIVARLRAPYEKGLEAPAVNGVFLTSFVIQ